ncbi:MAG: hypothetical protein ACLQU2_18705 [Candidatus Binataceae bacterium]
MLTYPHLKPSAPLPTAHIATASMAPTVEESAPATAAPPPAGANYIDTYLAGKHCTGCPPCLYKNGDPSPLVGQGSNFESNGTSYQVDPRLIVAIAGEETEFGLRTCCTFNNNAWNWFFCGRHCQGNACKHSIFDSWQSGIKTLDHYMRKSYLSHNLNTIALIGHRYCSAKGCEPWVLGVTKFYRELGGDPSKPMP